MSKPWLHPDYIIEAELVEKPSPLLQGCLQEIIPLLYIGDCSHNESYLRYMQIEVLIDCTVELIPRSYLQYHKLYIDDNLDININQYLEKGFKLIKDALREGKRTLVYCSQGISRSATLVIYYLMKTQQITKEIALRQILQKWPRAQPNYSFWQQL